jgi:2,4-dienoyl-CoA reductase-like NADH-dependent reductase (Old Yellow Enzyme family)
MNSGEGVLAKLFYGIVFQKPRPMTAQDVEEVISAFVRGAQVAIESGFDGVQIHCSHGCEYI